MTGKKEAQARIKINKMLEESGWRFLNDENGKLNIELEPGIKISPQDLDKLGDDFENIDEYRTIKKGFIDYLLLDVDNRPVAVLEAKRDDKDPLFGKEQARLYAKEVGARFIILSNGSIHYLWDTKHGNPETITRFPTQESLSQYEEYQPNSLELSSTPVDENYVLSTQMPTYGNDPDFKNDKNRSSFLKKYNLKQLRPYQVKAIKALQDSAKEGNQRFLFEMATGTGKTLVSAAVIKLFLKSGNARRILFLVDRLELEDQAKKAFVNYLGKDFTTVVYKENKDSWQNANVVVSTIQTFMAGDRYKREFSPTDFEFVISDEAHRSIGGNSRVVFEYFVGYKLGLTATPKDYLKGFDEKDENSQREYERRVLMDTYKTFGCPSGEPTFRYDLLSGVADGFLINPVVVDARTQITAKLLSKDGYAVHKTTVEGDSINGVFEGKHYERKFFNEETNIAMCKAFTDNGLYDPVLSKIGLQLFGKSIVFCVSQKHAARVTNILNKLAMDKWPDQYGESNFAMQVTSEIMNAQQMTINFSNNVLSGRVTKPSGYDSSKTRVAVTVGMMTTGYDCQDLLNIALMRPVFSPSDFVQIKGRGTRKWSFELNDYDNSDILKAEKDKFKFFDFFATCEYFENDFPYDEKLELPRIVEASDEDQKASSGDGNNYVDENGQLLFKGPVILGEADNIETVVETPIGREGMRLDREGYRRAVEEDVLGNEALSNMWNNGDTEQAEQFTKQHIFDKPKNFLNLDTIKKVFGVDRRLSIREFLQVAFGEKEKFEMKDELLESEWSKFMEINPIGQNNYTVVKSFFNAYIEDSKTREIIDNQKYAELNFNPAFSFEEFNELKEYKSKVPTYVKDYVTLNTFMD